VRAERMRGERRQSQPAQRSEQDRLPERNRSSRWGLSR
jgi:hypothetical protein